MKRYGPGWAHLIAMPTFEDPPPDGGGGGGGKDAAYWEAEAKKAFQARDNVKAEMKKLQEAGLVLTPEQKARQQELEDAAAKADEEKKRAAGQFDTLKQQLVEKHTAELTERDTKLSTLSTRFQNTVVRAEFGTASELFGGHAESKTVLDVDMAISYLGRYVSVQDDEKDARGYRIVVKDAHGNEIVDGKGNPVPFAKAIAEVIATLPNKDRILRGSGKAGSGSSGGGDGIVKDADLETLTRQAAKGNANAIKALRDRRAGNSIVKGNAWEQKTGT